MIDRVILNALTARLAESLAPPRETLRPFVVDDTPIGALDPRRAERLRAFPDVFAVGADVRFVASLASKDARTAALDRVARALAADGELTAWRGERYGVRERFDDAPRFLIERAAARFFGIRTFGAHVNGTTVRRGRAAMWLARRSRTKAIDPAQLDNLVGGGIPAGETIGDAVTREAWEEAGIPATLASRARLVSTLVVRRTQPDGIHWETLFAHDLDLPDTFVPANQDGEAGGHRLVDIDEAARLAGLVDDADAMTADAALVVADWLLRHGHVPPSHPSAALIARFVRGDVG